MKKNFSLNKALFGLTAAALFAHGSATIYGYTNIPACLYAVMAPRNTWKNLKSYAGYGYVKFFGILEDPICPKPVSKTMPGCSTPICTV